MKELSIIVITLNRYKLLERTVNAVLNTDNNRTGNYELLIVDQSNNNKTKELISHYEKKFSSIRYLYCKSQGAGHARNFGARHALGKIIAFIDDDCIPEKDWAGQIVDFFNTHGDAVVLFGNVVPVSYDLHKGRVSGGYKKDHLYKGRMAMICQDGTSGNMAVRSEIFNTIHGFDEVLANQNFGAEDWDFGYRILAFGYPVHHSSKVTVYHDGFKPWEELLYVTYRKYEQGTAAMFIKHLRCGDIISFWVWMWTLLSKIRRIIVTGLKLENKTILARFSFIGKILFLYFTWNIKGCLLSFKYKIDKRKKLYNE